MNVQLKASLLLITGALVAACGAPSTHHSASPAAADATTTSTTTETTTVASSTTAAATSSTTTSVPRSTVSAASTPHPSTTVATTAPCPSNLASRLATTGASRQLITVDGPSYDSTAATVEIWQRAGPCWIPSGGPWTGRVGENGFSDHHTEGDGTTPTGLYGIGPVMYGNASDPGVHEPYHLLVCGDWWDEDPRSAQYNTFQHVQCGQTPPFGGGSEALWTETQAYPSFAVIDYNTNPVVPYAGSAIFLHADTGTATNGCVSLPLAELDNVLRWINPADSPAVVMSPASKIESF